MTTIDDIYEAVEIYEKEIAKWRIVDCGSHFAAVSDRIFSSDFAEAIDNKVCDQKFEIQRVSNRDYAKFFIKSKGIEAVIKYARGEQ